MDATVLWLVVLGLVLGFAVGGVAVLEATRENPLHDIRLSGPFLADGSATGAEGGYITVRNLGKAARDLSGWTISGSDDEKLAFPDGFVLDAGATVTVYTKCAEGEKRVSAMYWCATHVEWPASGGHVVLEAPDATIVDIYTYTYVCPTCLIQAAQGKHPG